MREIVKEVEVESSIRVAIEFAIGWFAMDLLLYPERLVLLLFSRPFSIPLCLSHFPPLALPGIPALIPRWPVTEAYPCDL